MFQFSFWLGVGLAKAFERLAHLGGRPGFELFGGSCRLSTDFFAAAGFRGAQLGRGLRLCLGDRERFGVF